MKRKLTTLLSVLLTLMLALSACGGGDTTPKGGTLTLNETAVTLGVGGGVQLTVVSGLSDGDTVAWTSSNEDAVTVSSEGYVTALAVGTAIIAAVAGQKSGACTVTVSDELIGVPSLAINLNTAVFYSGLVYNLTATLKVGNTVIDTEAEGIALTWSSTNTAAATVVGGTVNALSEGETTVGVSCVYGGATLSDSALISVTALYEVTAPAGTVFCAVGDVRGLSYQAYTFENNAQLAIPAAQLEFTSSNTGVVTVDADGELTAAGRGAAKVKIAIAGKPAQYIEIDVRVWDGMISTPEEFMAISSPQGSVKEFVLMNDIDFTGVSYVPVNNFDGLLDGNGYSLTNLDLSGLGNATGVINNLYGKVQNIGFENVYFDDTTGGTRNQGMIAGTVKPTGSVANIYFDNCWMRVEDGYSSTYSGFHHGNAYVAHRVENTTGIVMENIVFGVSTVNKGGGFISPFSAAASGDYTIRNIFFVDSSESELIGDAWDYNDGTAKYVDGYFFGRGLPAVIASAMAVHIAGGTVPGEIWDTSGGKATLKKGFMGDGGIEWESDYTVDREPTCAVPGEKSIHAVNSSARKDVVLIPAFGHDWDAGVVTTEPDCTTAGVKTYTCGHDSGHKHTEPIAALGHDPQFDRTVSATATAQGYDVYICSRCADETYSNYTPYAPSAITQNAASNGSYTVTSGGSAVTQAKLGDTVTVTAAPVDDDYYTVSVAVSGTSGPVTVDSSVMNVYTFTMPGEAVSVTVTFAAKPTYTVTVKNGGDVLATVSGVKYGAVLGSANEPEKFLSKTEVIYGWTVGGSPFDFASTAVTDNIQVDAVLFDGVIWSLADFLDIGAGAGGQFGADSLDGKYILAADLDLSAYTGLSATVWPAMAFMVPGTFTGVFDGNGYAFKDLRIIQQYPIDGTNPDRKSIFENIGAGGVVRNTAFTGVKIADLGWAHRRAALGVVAFTLQGAVENCYLQVAFEVPASASYANATAGGIARLADHGSSIINCIVDITTPTDSSADNIGSLIGDSYTASIMDVFIRSGATVTRSVNDLSGGPTVTRGGIYGDMSSLLTAANTAGVLSDKVWNLAGSVPALKNGCTAAVPVFWDYVSSIDDFLAIKNNLSGSYILIADLDFASFTGLLADNTIDGKKNLVPGTFTGTFDGNGYAIKNLNMVQNTDAAASACGVFERIGAGGIVKNTEFINITLDHKNGTGGRMNTSGVVASVLAGGTIQDCYISVKFIEYATTGSGSGCVVGWMTGVNPTIENCIVDAQGVNGNASYIVRNGSISSRADEGSVVTNVYTRPNNAQLPRIPYPASGSAVTETGGGDYTTMFALLTAAVLDGVFDGDIWDLSGSVPALKKNCTITVPLSELYDGLIYTIADFLDIENNLSGKYLLMNDLDFSAYIGFPTWEYVKRVLISGEFTGIFDGNGYAIKDLAMLQRHGEFPCGIFETIGAAGVVKNTAFTGITISAYDEDGTLGRKTMLSGAVTISLSGLIQNCYIQVTHNNIGNGVGTYHYDGGGGVAGRSYLGASIIDCIVDVTTPTNSSADALGSLVGPAWGTTTVTNVYIQAGATLPKAVSDEYQLAVTGGGTYTTMGALLTAANTDGVLSGDIWDLTGPAPALKNGCTA
ncbi:MAG: Ig-like domain-containing protein [Firmicutes bacterium]|nr:Ig-like domain-containing protein [Bacillota bacterium]